ncbi:exonuclease SbcCD subunit D [Cerasibacillus terrae]|uniref:Nuclease SbcCD subunit D n=1 Tax=Cerasibacillus terrae TaxID=2498845 RepID=A0A5C8NRL4_9BACI|nr:exonuclease SbcCD subunit D [Cerasibacillus terrae]TXL64396.1 exonuclease SbcCD subunit D [Cerasibacillus terrae]
MKFFHTGDWHLGKLVQGVYMTEDQRHILQQFIQMVDDERPDAVIIAGDLYDRAVPPTEAVHLLDEVLEKIVLGLKIPVLSIAGNHDSPSRLHFGSKIMENNGLYMVGRFSKELEPVVLEDEHGEVHFHLIPYADPSVVRNALQLDEVRSHNEAMENIVIKIKENMDPNARHVFVGHAFVTPYGEKEENTSDSERPLSIGGSEYVEANHFTPFHYTALGHLHRAHAVGNEKIRYSGSLLKYSISEEHHKKGFFMVELDGNGDVSVEKRSLEPKRDVRTVEAEMEDLLTYPVNEDYVFVKLLDETPILSPMEKVRSVFPNAMHVERKHFQRAFMKDKEKQAERTKMSNIELFQAFYEEIKGEKPTEEAEEIFQDVLEELLQEEREEEHVKN